MTASEIALLIASSRHTPTIYRSRVYGYKIIAGKPIEIVSHEAEVIRRVFACESLSDLAIELRQKGTRNRSGRPFTLRYLLSLIRHYYTGCEGIYPAVVTEAAYRAAEKRLRPLHSSAPRG